MANQQDAFLSYTGVDDEFFGGAITSLRKFLELGVQVVTGNPGFNIFQDIDGIELGQQWQERLDQAVAGTRFLIPIMTPLFFHSEACRDELGKFVAHEKTLGRNDLILPIYYVTTPVLEKAELLKEDVLAAELSSRQRYDWRSQAHLPITDTQVRVAVMKLSGKIAEAIARSQFSAPGSTGGRFVPGGREAAFKEGSEAIKLQETPKNVKGPQKKILWVDDRPENNVAERAAMQTYNVGFTLALSTGEALAQLRKDRFDAIISDMGRPPDPRAGYTLLEAVRGSGDSTPFFIYAGSRAPEHVREALNRGAQGSTNLGEELIYNVLRSIGIRREDIPGIVPERPDMATPEGVAAALGVPTSKLRARQIVDKSRPLGQQTVNDFFIKDPVRRKE